MGEDPVSELIWHARPGMPRQEYLRAALDALARVFPCDSLGWNSLDVDSGTVEAFGNPEEMFGPQAPTLDLLAQARDHPMVVSYWSDPFRLGPRRLSDVGSRHDLRRTMAYDALLHPYESEYQFTILTQRSAREAGGCWTFNRKSRDFSDDELALAERLQPLLILIERTWGLEREADASRSSLSGREAQILGLLATGITASAIGTRLGISRATVNKHLEHIYRKLGVRDRVSAVRRARAWRTDAEGTPEPTD